MNTTNDGMVTPVAERLSKSRFQLGLQCKKALWLQCHQPDLADLTSEGQQHIFDTGTRVGELARELFPDGVLVEEDHRHCAEALETTAKLMEQTPSAIFEAAFVHNGVFIRPDILVRTDDGSWHLGEVKSSTKAKLEHQSDIAVQAWVLEGCGLDISRIELVHIDNSYVWDGGPHDLRRLFKAVDMTKEARDWQERIPALVDDFLCTLSGPMPEIRIGRQCTTPYTCAFTGHCHAYLPERYPVTALPRISSALLDQLLDKEFLSIADIPPDHPGLTVAQRAVVGLVRDDLPYIEGRPLDSLSKLEFPLHFVDFETLATALPIYPGTRPYQQVPFQWSDHVLHADGRLDHLAFLWQHPGDPRQAFLDTLITALGERGSIIHYSPFELSRLKDLAEAFPRRRSEIQAVTDRLFDLQRTVRSHVRHPECLGLTSIKVVLPALVGGMNYKGLAVADGQTATLRYLSTLDETLPRKSRKRIYDDLLAYCATDTLAMVELYKALTGETGGTNRPGA